MKLQSRWVTLAILAAVAAGCGSEAPSTPTPDVAIDLGDDTPAADAQPDASVDDASQPDAPADDAAQPDASVDDAAQPDVSVDDAAQPDASAPDASAPDVSQPDASAPDVAQPDVAVMDVPRADAAPDVAVMDVARPDAAPDAAVMDVARPDVGVDAVVDVPRPDVALDVSVDVPRPDVSVDVVVDVPRPDVALDVSADVPRPDAGLDVAVMDVPRVDAAPDVPAGPRCGNRVVETGEECDDGNTARWDGCSDRCRLEQTVRIDGAQLIGGNTAVSRACDLTGDSVNDNRLGQALTDLALGQLNPSLQTSFTDGSTIVLAHFLDLDDRLGVSDPSIRLAFFEGLDAVAPFEATPGEAFAIRAMALDAARNPVSVLSPGSITARALVAGPGTATLALALGGPTPTPLTLQRARTNATTTTDGTTMRIGTLTGGRLCGALSAGDLDRIPAPMGLPAACLSARGGTSMLDVIATGCTVVIVPVINAQQPDIDLGGDGIFSGGSNRALRDTNNDRIIDTCRDGSTGVTITGDNCAQDPRFDDAYSAALTYTARRVVITAVR